MELSRQEFADLREQIYTLCGLTLADDKAYLIEQRLEPVARAAGCTSFRELAQRLRSGDFLLREQIVEAMSTCETSFFRDGHPFDAIRQGLLPQLGQRPRRSPLRLWSAACSTGQEPYSLAMILLDFVNAGFLKESEVSVLATDISSRVLAQAAAAEYSDWELMRGIGPEQRRYFQRKGDRWIVDERVRRLVTFRRLNLVQRWPDLGLFDLILCRNVLIYFNEETRRDLAERFFNVLTPPGVLLLGAAENLLGICDRFESTRIGDTIVYRKRS